MITPIRSHAHAPAASARRGEAPRDDGAEHVLESAVARGDVVRYGSLEVPARHAREFETAANYLSRDPKMRAVLQKAQHQERPLHLAVNDRDDDSFDPATRTVNWDPYSALRTSEGGRQSPALGLGHELDHATVDPRVRTAGAWQFDAHYDNAEERRVVEGSETHAARTLGEDIRHDHAGSAYAVSSPILRRIA